jgi:peptidoglycan/xylan/chitin deacetylase (PgdA/CDA1 family)
MSLFVLSYRRAKAGADGNSPEMLDAHFEYLAANFANVLPGDPLPPHRRAVCIGFDGAFRDFYERVFPLLTKHKLRAVLAVTPAVIRDDGGRLGGRRQLTADHGTSSQSAARPFCSWGELQEMVDSGSIAVAAHGYTHRPLDKADNDVATEVHVPRTLLSARLRVPVESFVFPFGRYSAGALREARDGYRHVFVDAMATNRDWGRGVVFRIPCDALKTPTAPLEGSRLLVYRTRALWYRLRLGS